MQNKNIIGERLKECRKQSGLKQDDVAKELQVQRQIISYYETGTRQPNTDDIVKLAKLYKTSTDYLLGLTNIYSVHEDMKAIGEFTGLDDDAIYTLNTWVENKDIFSDMTKTINFILKQEEYNILLELCPEIIVNGINEVSNYTPILNRISAFLNRPFLKDDKDIIITRSGKFTDSDKEKNTLNCDDYTFFFPIEEIAEQASLSAINNDLRAARKHLQGDFSCPQ